MVSNLKVGFLKLQNGRVGEWVRRKTAVTKKRGAHFSPFKTSFTSFENQLLVNLVTGGRRVTFPVVVR